jgi:hypothetical protein
MTDPLSVLDEPMNVWGAYPTFPESVYLLGDGQSTGKSAGLKGNGTLAIAILSLE